MLIYVIGGESSNYIDTLKEKGHNVINQNDTSNWIRKIDMCRDKLESIKQADEIHIIFETGRPDIYFDMGMAFALKKRIKIIEDVVSDSDLYGLMLREWRDECKTY